MKICKRCGIEKPITEFSNASRNKDGLNSWCKTCCSEYDRQYREKHKDEISHKTKVRYAENRLEILEKQKQHYHDNKDKFKKYREENKDRIAAQQAEYRRTHKDEAKEYQKMWYHKNKDIAKQQRQAKLERLHKLKTSCVKCGETRPYVIDFHHIDPNTKEFEPSQLINGSNSKLTDELKKCVCLCRNCHAEFHYRYGNKPEHPVEALQEYLHTNPYELTIDLRGEIL